MLMNKYIGCDLGGTNLKAAIVDTSKGKVIRSISQPTQAREGHDAVMGRMAALFLRLLEEEGLSKEDIGGVGIGVPGLLDLDKGTTLFLPNLQGTWPDVPLKATIEAKTGIQTYILNDVRSITLGEWTFGAGKGFDTVAVFAIGTGIGGGLVINGRLHMGIGGTGGELGHMIIDFNGPQCGCGNYGCLETYASGPAIASMGIKAVVQGLTTMLSDLCKGDLNKITPELITLAAQKGDKIANEIMQKAGFYMGVAAGNICAAIGPRRIIVAGGVSNAGDLILKPMRHALKRITIMPVEQVSVVPAKLGDDAGVIGAALWASQQIQTS